MKYITLVALAFLLASCSPFGLNPMGYEVKHEDLDTAWRKVSAMKYIPEDGNYWKSPVEFFRDGGGDCEDFSAALVYLLGPEASAICYESTRGLHCIVLYNGVYIEPQIYGRYIAPKNIQYVLTYAKIMEISTTLGIRSL